MNIDDTKMIAKMHAEACGCVSSVASFVRRAGLACVLACTAFAAVASAQDRNGFRKDDLQQQQRDERSERNAQRQDMPRFDQRDLRDSRDDARRQQDHNAERQRQSGRLTADERRDLRRQINEAGVDLYPNTPRR